MSILSISASRARANFFDLLDMIEQYGRVVVTRHGKIKAVLLDPEELEGLEETREILATKGALSSIERGLRDAKAGKLIPFEEVVGKSPSKNS